jgi:hypothetical protein
MKLFLAFALSAVALPALAQTYVPGQAQANLNQFQSQLQASQLQHLQQQNNAALSSPNPGIQAQAQVRQQSLQQQIDQSNALQQQMLSPHANPTDINARLQQNQSQIQPLEQPLPILPTR